MRGGKAYEEKKFHIDGFSAGVYFVFSIFFVQPVIGQPITVYVDDDADPSWYDVTHVKTIQEGIGTASAGDTIFVFNGTYYENIVIDKTINLIGEARNGTIIDGGESGNVIYVSANRVNISRFTIRNSSSSGYSILIWGSSNTIYDNNIKDNSHGVLVSSSHNNTIYGNTIANTTYDGISILSILFISSNNTIYRNIIANNRNGVAIVSGSPNNLIYENNITNNRYDGVYLGNSFNNSILGNTVTGNNRFGIHAFMSSDNTLERNTITNNKCDGIYLDDASKNTVKSNTFVSNGITIQGDSLLYWNTHTLENNTANAGPILYYKDTSGVVVPSGTTQVILANCTNFKIQDLNLSNVDIGIQLGFSSHNSILGNTIVNNDEGIYLYVSSNNALSENNISNNSYGIYIEQSNDNIVYHNSLTGNNQNAYDCCGTNTWDNSYPSGGNYWSDFDEPREGAYDNNSDGIVDSPYDIPDGSNQDRYPLMYPWGYTPPVSGPVGGIIVSVDKLSLLAPYIVSIAFLSIMISMIAIGINTEYVRHKKGSHRKK